MISLNGPLDINSRELNDFLDVFASSAIRLGQVIERREMPPLKGIADTIEKLDRCLGAKPDLFQRHYLAFHRDCYAEIAALRPQTIKEYRSAISTILGRLRTDLGAIEVPELTNR